MKNQLKNKSASTQFLKTDGGTTKSNAIEAPAINLPKGGGALKGIDEKFSVNSVNGTASFSIPLPVSQARALTPALTLSYNSGSGNGLFGLGWNLSIGSIRRKTDKKLPQYFDAFDSDVFLFLEAEDLVPVFEKDGNNKFIKDAKGDFVILEKPSADGNYKIRHYRPRIEGLFARIERWTKTDGSETKWRIINKDNTTTLFGWTANSRISDPNDASRIFEWLPEFIFDDKGNCSQYVYRAEDAVGFDPKLLHHRNRRKNGQLTYTNIYIEKLLYGNKTPYSKFSDPFPVESDFLFSTVFDYGENNVDAQYDNSNWFFRPDAFSEYKSGFEIRTTRLCKRVLLFHHFRGVNEYDGLVKSIDFQYDTAIEQDFTFLKSTTIWGYIKKADDSYSKKSLPPMEYEYQKHDWNKEVKAIAPEDLVHAPVGMDEAPYQFVDLYNEGLSGILTEQAGGWYYKHNLGSGKFEQAKLVTPKPSFAGLGGALQLADLDADGGKQLVSFSEPRGYFELDDDNDWQPFRNFRTLPNVNFNDPYTRQIDLNGDGKPELLITEDQVFTWYESEGRAGFSAAQKTPKPFDEEAGPHIVFADPKQTIFLADMSGDGLTDIARIRNGEVCYWPNLGYGRFGAKVAMDNAPVFDAPDAFNSMYLKLADIDGSGPTDIIYLGKNKFTCWKNLSGNRFDPNPFEIEAFPAIHRDANITVTDLLGNGVACIVWSSPLPADAPAPLCYIDLMNGKKPHIMVGYRNNMGKEVTLEYAPSTKFYLDDKKAGKPWVTKLHFPVHCVAKTTTEDKISGHKYTAQYKYHHGYYDHAEREFRGFGMVEQIDAETFEHWTKSGATNITDAELHQEPVISRQWVHTGAFLRKDKILTQFEQEYWYHHPLLSGIANPEIPLPDAVIVDTEGNPVQNLSAEEWQQALRACKGMALRSEVFAHDAVKHGNTPDALRREQIPYTVATHNCKIELLQPKGQNHHAVFVVKESEAITYNYERAPEDPRIAHNLNLKLDEYGNVLESVAVVYPRKMEDPSLPDETKKAQAATHIIFTKNQFTNDAKTDDAWRMRLPSEVETYELKGVSRTGTFFAPADFDKVFSANPAEAVEVFYHEIEKAPATSIIQRRKIEHVRSLFYKNNLSGALALGVLETRAMPFENYQLAYTPELLDDLFSAKANHATLQNLMVEGKFQHSEGDQNWWIRSGTTQFLKNLETETDAAARFYTPVSFTDPFGSVTKVKYYGTYHLFIEETEDALGNTAKVDAFNFRTLSPRRMRDPNNNLSEAISDELGLVKAMALMGKGAEADDLQGLSEITDNAENTLMQGFFNAPLLPNGIADSTALADLGKQLLQHATARFVYDFEVYQNTGKPNVVASIMREEHFAKNANAPVQLSFEYSNGSGEVAMKKGQAESGKAKLVTENADGSVTITEPDTGTALRWIGNGRTIKNNKGNPVKQYEPYFSVNNQYEDYEALVESGVTPVLYYDAVGRMVKTEMPDGTFSKTEFDSWKQLVFDANDTVLQSLWYQKRSVLPTTDYQRQAADAAALHADTPTVQHFDTLGRPVLSIEHNKNVQTGVDEFYPTILHLDIEGNVRKVVDARQKALNDADPLPVMQYKYDLLGHRIYQNSMDAGQRWLLTNALGKPLRTWDERGHEFQYGYDMLHRPTESKILGGDGTTALNHIFEKIMYGEGQPNDQANNLRGQVFQHFDTGGRLEMPDYDFKGKPNSTSRRLFSKYKEVANWTGANLTADLEAETFTFQTETDALGRISRQVAPDGSVILPSYNAGGLLDAESVTHPGRAAVSYLKDIDYNEKGQRERIRYGNDVVTKFEYDAETFRLLRLVSRRANGDLLQDLRYTYDPSGNITHLDDLAVPQQFFNNYRTDGLRTFKYDALYRLIEATGRENDQPLHHNGKDNWHDAAFMVSHHPNDGMAMRPYVQQYQFDAVGNILQMRHQAVGNTANNWTRNYEYETTSNRLKKTEIGGTAYHYDHHATHGFMAAMPHLEEVGWSFKEEIVRTIRMKVNSGTPETTYYQYDGQGQRIRKITENASASGNPTVKEERIYVAGYELYKKPTSDGLLERVSLSLLDEGHRFVMVERRNQVDDGTELHLVRYQLHNHLGSACLELDNSPAAAVISYEEYHPFGTTAYQARNSAILSAAKRYRFTGMERDEETGLSYHSARYYLPWLGTWGSCDPLVHKTLSLSPYAYCTNNPILYIDPNGKENIVVVGGQYDNSAGNKLMFVHQGLRQLKHYQVNEKDENRSMVLFTEGYTEKQMQKIEKAAMKYGATLIKINSAEELTNYVNSKSKDNSNLSADRKSDTASNVDIFAHGVVGSVEFGYKQKNAESAKFDSSDASRLNPSAFGSGAVVCSYACRTGLGNAGIDSYMLPWEDLMKDKSLAQSISNNTGATVKAFLKRTDYSDTLSSKSERIFLKMYSAGLLKGGVYLLLNLSLQTELSNRENVDGATFDPDGARHPVTGGDSPVGVSGEMQTYKPQKK